jgi:alpha-tubulin suppressor-like RCC1 family protein
VSGTNGPRHRALGLLACAAAFAACEGGVSLHPSAGPAAGQSGAGGADGSLGTSGNAGTGGSLGASGNASTGGSSLGSSGSAGSSGFSGTGDASQESGGTGTGGTDGLGSDASDAGTTDAGDGGDCPSGCPDNAPVCSTGACRKVTQIAPGGGHICALVEDGTVRCWGVNNVAQLGDGSIVSRMTPGPAISQLTDVIKLGVGIFHACAVTRSGSVWCWGQNYYGQLGFTGETAVPVEVQNLGGPAAEVICHGNSSNRTGQTCARMRSGRVKCWGSNVHGQLGNGTRDQSATPVEVLSLTDAVRIGMSEYAVCAVKSTGKVVCWGYNGLEAELATGSADEFVTSPEEVVGLSDATTVEGGERHFCAITGSQRRVKCWGWDNLGVLGDGPPHNGMVANTPVDTFYYPVEEVRAAWRSTCVRLDNDDVVCWGFNSQGLLGTGDTVSTDGFSARTLLAAPAVGIDYRWRVGCAVLNTGRVQCWGNYEGFTATRASWSRLSSSSGEREGLAEEA